MKRIAVAVLSAVLAVAVLVKCGTNPGATDDGIDSDAATWEEGVPEGGNEGWTPDVRPDVGTDDVAETDDDGGCTAEVGIDADAPPFMWCETDDDCIALDRWCERRCFDATGFCQAKMRPEWCGPAPKVPQCGCDGVSYESECLRMMAQVGLRHWGACLEDACVPTCGILWDERGWDIAGVSWLDSCTGEDLCDGAGIIDCLFLAAECRDDPVLGPSWFAYVRPHTGYSGAASGCSMTPGVLPTLDYIMPAAGGVCP